MRMVWTFCLIQTWVTWPVVQGQVKATPGRTRLWGWGGWGSETPLSCCCPRARAELCLVLYICCLSVEKCVTFLTKTLGHHASPSWLGGVPWQVWAMLIGRRGPWERSHWWDVPSACLLRRPLVQSGNAESQKGPDTSSLFPRCGDEDQLHPSGLETAPQALAIQRPIIKAPPSFSAHAVVCGGGFSTITAELGGRFGPWRWKPLYQTQQKKLAHSWFRWILENSLMYLGCVYSPLSTFSFSLLKTYMLSMCCVPAPGTERLASVLLGDNTSSQPDTPIQTHSSSPLISSCENQTSHEE